MKFLKLELVNFEPYYDRPNEPHEILLFDDDKKNKNITLNIGPNEHGKTSISNAIMWCLFGDFLAINWKKWINTLSIKIAKQKNENEVNMCIRLTLDINGEKYKIIRQASYNISSGDGEVCPPSIIKDGEPIEEDSTQFIRTHFPDKKLMNYFIFDADDILKKFEENREGAIKDHVNKLIGVEKLDEIILCLSKAKESYDEDISNISGKIDDETSGKIKVKESDKKQKNEAIKKLDSDISVLKNEINKILKGKKVTEEEEKLCRLYDERDNLKQELDDINQEFIESEIIKNIDLLLATKIIDQTSKELNKKQTTKEEFDSSSILIKSSLGDKYSGIFYNNDDIPSLILNGTAILDSNLEKTDKLGLKTGEGHKTETIKVLKGYQEKIQKENIVKKFEEFKNRFDKVKSEYNKKIANINLIGDTSQNRVLRDKVKSVKSKEGKINQKERIKKEIKDAINEINKDVEKLDKQLNKNEEQEKEIDIIKKKKSKIDDLIEIVKKSKNSFLNDLLQKVNENASEIMRNTVKDTNRFHSIEINSDYQFKVKQNDGEILDESQINKSTLQISMMSFFFALSNQLERKVPYVIDDPLLRLDPGHDKRLINQISKTNEQLIFHLIPGKEYTDISYKWLSPHINIQNWIYRNKYQNLDNISYVEKKDPDSIIEFDIDTF